MLVPCQHLSNIVPGLSVRRDAPVPQNGVLAGIIGSQDFGEISIEEPEQVAKVSNASGEILMRIEGVGNTVAGGSLRHKLH